MPPVLGEPRPRRTSSSDRRPLGGELRLLLDAPGERQRYDAVTAVGAPGGACQGSESLTPRWRTWRLRSDRGLRPWYGGTWGAAARESSPAWQWRPGWRRVTRDWPRDAGRAAVEAERFDQLVQ